MDERRFFEEIRSSKKIFTRQRLTQSQVDGVSALITAWRVYGGGRRNHFSWILGAVYYETGTLMTPVREGFSDSDSAARRVVKNRRYGHATGAYSHVYYGRGHIQLTWMRNYRASSDDVGVDLVKHPDAMLDSKISARLAIKGVLDGRWNASGKGLGSYLSATKSDYKNARRTVNVLDKWATIKVYALAFEHALKVSGHPEHGSPGFAGSAGGSGETAIAIPHRAGRTSNLVSLVIETLKGLWV